MLTPRDGTRIGIAYRSEISHEMSGTLTFHNFAAQPSTQTKVFTPQNVIVSLYQEVGEKFVLLAEAGWSDWSVVKNSILEIANTNLTIPRDWSDTWRAGIGGMYKLNPKMTMLAGFSYDSSPTKASRRLPDLPMDRQLRYALGMKVDVNKYTSLTSSVGYEDFGRANIRTGAAPQGVLSGSYPVNNGVILAFNANIKFD